MLKSSLPKMIDHTLLKANAELGELQQLCKEAVDHGFYSVCINPRWLPIAAELVQGSSVLPITVVGFPLGANAPSVKIFETGEAVKAGAREIDMVLDLSSVKSGLWRNAEMEIRNVVKAAQGLPVKVILETCYLSHEEIVQACEIAVEAGARFVKTSTGFGSAGATIEHIRLMRQTVGPDFGVKASGGIRDYATARAMIEAGANRLGCSASVAIVAAAPTPKGGASHERY